MVEIIGTDIYRDGIKIGMVGGDSIYDKTGRKVGFFSATTVFDGTGRTMAQIEGDYVSTGGRSIELEQIISKVSGVGVSDTGKVAISMFLGD
jgi:hypothetical protein